MYIRRFYLIGLFIAFLALSSIGCTKGIANENKPQGNSIPEITTPQETLKELPDSSYLSIDQLTYIIENHSEEDGTLESMENQYDAIDGVFAFRGQPSRNPHFKGCLDSVPSTIEIDWQFKTAMNTQETKYGIWYGGTGWTGQPLYINWSDSAVQSRMPEIQREKFSGKEIIISSLCGKVYFIDLETGKERRQSIDLVNPIKGTAMLDPSMNGNLYVGHGIPCEQPFGQNVVNIYQEKLIQSIKRQNGIWRGWNAFDSSSIAVGQFVFWAGENGMLFKFLRSEEGLKLHTTMKYKAKNRTAPGMEASIAVYRNYGYVSDNHGNIICVNLNNLKPIWRYNNLDDSDGTPIIEEDKDGDVYLYSATEVDKCGEEGYSRFVKLNALNGELVWEQKIACNKRTLNEKTFDGGMFASPLLGDGDCSDLIFSNFVINKKNGSGDFIAINKNTGEIVYQIALKHYAWSSPIAFYTPKNEMYIFTADTYGHVYLIEGKSGKIILTQKVGSNFESSPVAIDNQVVIGSRGNTIYKLNIQ